VRYFPLIGILIGLGVAGLDYGLCLVFAPLPASVIAVIALIGASGGLHMDGLADTADGFFSSRPRERILEIMKDSRIGAMGVIAIVLVILLKVATLASVPAGLRFAVLILMPLAGRTALVIHLALLPYARAEGGLGTVFLQNRSRIDAVFATGILGVFGWIVAGMEGLIAGGLAVAGTLIFSIWCRRKIGGFTGDTLGAACEIAELAPALVGAAWLCASGGAK
jgi:adenosylcobinamide-GDP ribazoletransferase